MAESPETYRMLFCPICGDYLRCPVKGTIPEKVKLPDHVPKGNVNLCAGVVVSVCLDWDTCGKCGRKIGKHPSGVCIDCFEG